MWAAKLSLLSPTYPDSPLKQRIDLQVSGYSIGVEEGELLQKEDEIALWELRRLRIY